jgi:hypothetical protein
MRKTLTNPLMFAGILFLGVWLTAEGLSARFTGSYLTQGGLWQAAAQAAGLAPADLYWPLVWLGLTWLGVLMAVWSGSSWRYSSVLIVGVISLSFLGWGTALSVFVLFCALLPSGRKLLRDERPE